MDAPTPSLNPYAAHGSSSALPSPAGYGQPLLDAEGRLAEDVLCRRCGYNLRGLAVEGACPECGTAVGWSIHGDLLRFSEPQWVGVLASGMNWIVAGIVAYLVLMVMAVAGAIYAFNIGGGPGGPGGMNLMAVLLTGLSVVPGLLMVVGYWKVTTPELAVEETSGAVLNARTLARWGLVAAFVLGLVQSALQLSMPVTNQMSAAVVGLISGICFLVGIIALFVHMRHLALRVPDTSLASQTRVVMWGLIISYVLLLAGGFLMAVVSWQAVGGGGFGAGAAPAPGQQVLIATGGFASCAAAVGILVFLIWTLVLVFWYQRRLKESASYARQTWAGEQAQGMAGATGR